MPTLKSYELEINQGKRFRFGENWQRFLAGLTEERIQKAEETLKEGLAVESLEGQQFLDAGCGSGVFSLAARRLGARVHSFDYDSESTACANLLKQRFFPNDSDWIIDEGSVLDQEYLSRLGQFDVVYSWGVLHHTGAMWDAIHNIAALVRPGGSLFIAIYNNAGRRSKYWWRIKSLYVKYSILRPFLLSYAFLTTRSGWFLRGLLKGQPLMKWRTYGDRYRGMSAWHNLVDWVGGFPYEYAKPEEVFYFIKERGFRLERLSTMGADTGCNEFVFIREARIHE